MAAMKRLHGADLYRALKMIDEHTDKLENGKLRYHAGWSDETIALQVGVREDTVKHHRQKAFGNLERKGSTYKDKSGPTLRERMAELEARVEQLEQDAKRPTLAASIDQRPGIKTLGFAHAKNGV